MSACEKYLVGCRCAVCRAADGCLAPGVRGEQARLDSTRELLRRVTAAMGTTGVPFAGSTIEAAVVQAGAGVSSGAAVLLRTPRHGRVYVVLLLGGEPGRDLAFRLPRHITTFGQADDYVADIGAPARRA